MAELEVRNYDQADETRPSVEKGRDEILKLAGGTVGRGTFEPGWRRSEHVKPIAGTSEAPHMGYCISGRMVVGWTTGPRRRSARAMCSSLPPATTPRWSATSPASRPTSLIWRPMPRRPEA